MNWSQSSDSSMRGSSCFLGHSPKDEAIVERLYRSLRDAGVKCWYLPEDLEGFRTPHSRCFAKNGKLLLVLSKNSIDSDWVKSEVYLARIDEEEKRRNVGAAASGQPESMLLPVAIDDGGFDACETPWMFHLREDPEIFSVRWYREMFTSDGRPMAFSIGEGRSVVDFRNCEDGDTYDAAVRRLLRELNA